MKRPEHPMPREERDALIASAVADPTGEGFSVLGEELLLPCTDVLSAASLPRKLLRCLPSLDGALPTKILAFPRLESPDVAGIERVQTRALHSLLMLEASFLLTRLNRQVRCEVQGPARGAALVESLYKTYALQLLQTPAVILLPPAVVQDLDPDWLDPETQAGQRAAGCVGRALGVEIRTEPEDGEGILPPNMAYALPASDGLGSWHSTPSFSEPFIDQHGRGWAFAHQLRLRVDGPVVRYRRTP